MFRLVIVIASVTCATPALADDFQPKLGRFEAGVYGGVGFLSGRHAQYNINEGQNVPFTGTALGGGLRLAFFWPCRYAGVELEADGTFGTLTNDESATLIGIRAHLVMQGEGKMTPFFLAGAGVVLSNSDTLGDDEDPTVNLGVGVKYHFTDAFSLRIEARDSLTEGEMPGSLDDTVAHHFQFLVGVSFSFLGN